VAYRRHGWSYGVIKLDKPVDVGAAPVGAAVPAGRRAAD